jgi:F-type H+-transporting ATPase subunit b
MFVAPAFAQEAAEPAIGETHTETGVAGDGGHEGAFPPFDSSTYASQVLWLAITFGLFYLFLKRVVIPRISGTMEVRHDRIASDLDQAARLKEEADAAVAAYEQELADARRKSAAIAQEARDSAKAEAEADRRGISDALDAKLADAETRIEEIKRVALADVDSIAEETAGAIVGELIGGDVDKQTVAAAVKAVSQ